MKTLKGSPIKRSSKYGVGKKMMDSIYVHKSSEDVLSQNRFNKVKSILPDVFDYDIVKYNEIKHWFTFTKSKDWDISLEPIVGDAILVKDDGSFKFIKQKNPPQIYHHKWLFVKDDYSGFNVEESKNRSRQWLSIPNIDFNRIGSKKFWNELCADNDIIY